jgi:hypothetical protein
MEDAPAGMKIRLMAEGQDYDGTGGHLHAKAVPPLN